MRGSHANLILTLLLVLGCADQPAPQPPASTDQDLVQMDRIDVAIQEMETLDRDHIFQSEAATFRQVNQQIYAELRQARQREAEGDTLATVIIEEHQTTRRLLLESIENAQRILREKEGLTQ